MNCREYEYEYSKMVSDVEEIEAEIQAYRAERRRAAPQKIAKSAIYCREEPTDPDISIVLNDLEEVEKLWKRYECS